MLTKTVKSASKWFNIQIFINLALQMFYKEGNAIDTISVAGQC